MTPEYLEELADIADPDRLWELLWREQMDLPADKRRQLDAGVALRRHARDVRRLRELLECGRSLLVTPLAENAFAVMAIDTPAEHEKLREERKATAGVALPECDQMLAGAGGKDGR